MKLCFYVAKYGDCWDKIIGWFTKSKYSHIEIHFSDDWCFSSSPREGGVRFKRIELDHRWEIIDLDIPLEKEIEIKKWCLNQVGKGYNWFSLFTHIVNYLWFFDWKEERNYWYCSELCAYVLDKFEIMEFSSYRIDPGKIYTKMSNVPSSKPIFDNIKVLNQSGELIFTCSSKKSRWYLDKNLAEQVDEKLIRLNFETKGPGNQGDPYFLSEKANACVVCGSDKSINRHHIIPKQYRKYFPLDVKEHNHFDILPICVGCHRLYEIHASQLKKQLVQELDLSEDKELSKLSKKYINFKYHWDKIPQDRKDKLLLSIEDYFGFVNETVLDYLVKYQPPKVNISKLIVEKCDLDSFAMRWRSHFVDTMRPRFLPEFWSLEPLTYKQGCCKVDHS